MSSTSSNIYFKKVYGSGFKAWGFVPVSVLKARNSVKEAARDSEVRLGLFGLMMCCSGVPQNEGLQETLGAEKKVRGRTGWPQQVWALELNQ